MTTETQVDYVHSKALPDLIVKLITERQEVLVLFNRLAELKPYTEIVPTQALLQRFCQTLMDYMALGHFEVYQSLADGVGDSELCCRVRRLAEELYPHIAQTTENAVIFNDRYDGPSFSSSVNGLGSDLSWLGEHLATRIELEDRLIAAIRRA